MDNRHALVIEDDDDIAMLLTSSLSGAGFTVSRAGDGTAGVELARSTGPSVITLDVGLPGIDGLETTRRIRTFSDAHIIMLTARADEADVLMGLEAGADDYLTKPFRPRELRARVAAIMRRRDALVSPPSQATASDEIETLTHNGLVVRVDERTVHVDGQLTPTTRTEFDLLTALLRNRSRVTSKDELVRSIRDDHDAYDSYVSDADRRALEVHIGNLRRKIGEDAARPRWILTVRGVGYRLTAATHPQ
ncbi:response regulator transcription factor [Paramicrobacterium agarici]|uniref:response regulator transcription factor n=1 Tax=Paramicrobacterium agarici TaxID=630514 RepID=UPI00116E9A4F|nr:response regulator transcription factor [Microbacterium agarici]TQO23669.1 DNA-binding response OmpR family regulator [Microbacterium agarici]